MPEDAEENEEFLKLVHNVLLEVRKKTGEKNQKLILSYRLMFNKVKWFAPTALTSTRLEMVSPTCYWLNMKSKSSHTHKYPFIDLFLYYITCTEKKKKKE